MLEDKKKRMEKEDEEMGEKGGEATGQDVDYDDMSFEEDAEE
ncbi:MAG: hypothetical protein UT56_C0002G0036 [Candidatus Levybacteria bacterium GW2011_GWB1_39_7]|nr:MAG: hypothetical protein UT20_C0019G0018 [Candidatus Levybacteria bacterium GW2011_GWA1_39_11]KKR25222.1 MAG: hypothetical protein UT56_C0002G0036 [Candidatus Levybacteria bacterium GW2011_GWB1_39_7]KKR27135.1 MAG: hypothetical protein UT57_C0016G0005 [Microgenomates group bacterium GW2011_GWC1_39_7]